MGRGPRGRLLATAEVSLSCPDRSAAGAANPFNQLLDLGFPINLYGHSPLLRNDISALTLTSGATGPSSPE